jgi:predicted metal-binding membrane protein
MTLRKTLDRAEVIAFLGLLGLTSWAALAWMTLDMKHPWVMLMMPGSSAWHAANVVAVFAMWSVMMAAMMLPSAVPMIMTFENLERQRAGSKRTQWKAALFTAGFIFVWSCFSAAATLAQWALQRAGLLTTMIESASVPLTAALLVAAGLYQFSPLKQACLRNCRTPIGFLITEWRPGARGAWSMGVKHGVSCSGCCWSLMLLMFVAGAMNPVWIGALALVVALEKLAPANVSRLIGAALIAAGVTSLVALA